MKTADKIELFNSDGSSKGYYSSKNRLNNLTGREWVYWSKSVITNPYPPNLQHKLRSEHGAQKPPDLCADLIRLFTKEGDLVLDPLAGVGGTLLGAGLSHRRAIGIEINSRWIEIYREVCSRESIDEQRMILGDSSQELEKLAETGVTADFILTDVPYWKMDKVPKSKGKYKRFGESSRDNRQSKLTPFNPVGYLTKEEWLGKMRIIFSRAIRLLKRGRYLAVFIGDMYNQGEYHFLTADMAGDLRELGLTMKANLTWYDGSKSLHVYGYLYEYIPSLIHQNILIFRKESEWISPHRFERFLPKRNRAVKTE
ncbi:MAG TPA: class I SAM-dependent methyltransferase [Spirochaetia bacterium]|nr:class I SAM-dependent methyltransferase [Spirochaetia bacterium]